MTALDGARRTWPLGTGDRFTRPRGDEFVKPRRGARRESSLEMSPISRHATRTAD